LDTPGAVGEEIVDDVRGDVERKSDGIVGLAAERGSWIAVASAWSRRRSEHEQAVAGMEIAA
jgi:hypothetical protein